jgi:citrate lyase subunit alpha/citrate CoA-transferase
VDYVVVLDKIGEPDKIVAGTTAITLSKERLGIAEMTAKFVKTAGIIKDGFSFQAGAGGISLAFSKYVKEMMKDINVKARFIRGGSTKQLVEMLEEGLTDYILDGQTFDLEGVRSMKENPRHISTSPFTSYNWHGKGNFASQVDIVVLGATEVDVNFNANVVTHSDGLMLHGIGGWQNCLFSKCTILAIPSIRKNNPIIVDDVTTLVGPGELIDVVVTERGIAINPLRDDLIKATKYSGLPIRGINIIKSEIDELIETSIPKPNLSDKVISAVKWVDGTLIDSIYKIAR